MPIAGGPCFQKEFIKKGILIVDDDIAIRKGLKKLLKKANYDVAVAADGFEAVDRFASEPIDLLLLDLNMPGKDGWAAYENITRKDPYVPTIIMTGLPDQFPIAAAGGTGTLLEKPLEPKELLSVIESLLDEPRSNHWLRRRYCFRTHVLCLQRGIPLRICLSIRERKVTVPPASMLSGQLLSQSH